MHRQSVRLALLFTTLTLVAFLATVGLRAAFAAESDGTIYEALSDSCPLVYHVEGVDAEAEERLLHGGKPATKPEAAFVKLNAALIAEIKLRGGALTQARKRCSECPRCDSIGLGCQH